MARRLRKPLILNYHSGEAEDHLTRWPSAVRTLRLATRIVVPSPYLVDVFGRFGLKAEVVVNAVDLAAFPFRARGHPRPTFLSNRNFEAHYDVGSVLRAFARIQSRIPGASLTMAGDGPQRDALMQLAAHLSLRHTRFLGRVAPGTMPGLYDEHDFWLNASYIDNTPLSILEAYASGCAVVSTNPGGIPYMVEDGRTGRLVSCGEADALADAALEVLAEPELFADLARNGLAECSKYTWDSARRGWLAAYSAVASTNAMRPL